MRLCTWSHFFTLAYTKRKLIGLRLDYMENFNVLFASILSQREPDAVAWVKGNEKYPNLSGQLGFYRTLRNAILISVEIFGLPDEENITGFYGMHIHEYGNCKDAFEKTGVHYNPENVPHPEHAGDMPSLLSNHGYAWMAFFDQRLTIEEIIDRSVVIHKQRDDFTTQPSGDSGEKIGCGVIMPFKRVPYRK